MKHKKEFSKGAKWRVRGLVAATALSVLVGVGVVAAPAQAYSTNDFSVRTHIQNIGWSSLPGTRGQSLRVEAIQVTQLRSKVICLNAHVASIGWQTRQCTSGPGTTIAVGTTGRALAIEAVEVTRPGNSYGVGALAHIQSIGDRYTGVSAGVGGFIAGTTGRGLRLEWFELSNN